MQTPVTIDASSEHRNSAALARSSGVENRPMGIVERNLARISGVSSPMKLASSGVSPATGFSALTRTPAGASSIAIALVAVFIQPFEALYQLSRGRGETPAVEATFRIAPAPSSFICPTSARAVR